MSREVPAETIAKVLGLSVRAVQLRAERECWLHLTKRVRGGRQHLYPVLPLPPDVRGPVEAWIAQDEADQTVARAKAREAGAAAGARRHLAAVMDQAAAEAARQHGLVRYMTLPEPAKRRADAHSALADMAGRYWRSSGQPKNLAFDLFGNRYSAGEIEVPDWIRAEVSTCSGKTLRRWAEKAQSEGLASLAGRYGTHRIGSGVIDSNPALRDLVLGMLTEHPHCSAEHVMKAIRARFAEEEHPSYRTLQRWLRSWKDRNKQLLEKIRNPDAWRSRYQAAGGSLSEGVVRLNQRWETDSTRGDLILADGKRHVLVQIIDVFTRRMKLQVSRSSSSAAVASTLRRAILDWGVPEVLVTDNGSDYVSRHLVRALEGLGVERDVAPPFTPEHKAHVERAFGTFCRDLIELLPGFIGHSVADRKGIEARRSFAQRMTKGETVELRLTPEEFQSFCDRWTDDVYGRDTHSSLGNRSPFEVAAAWREPVRRIVDERALDVLLAPAPGGETRFITKKGIRIDGMHYEAPELGGLEGQQVRVLLDDASAARIWIFELEGGFLCEAVCPELLDISRAELTAARKAHQNKVMKEGSAALRKAAREHRTKDIAQDILAQRAKAAGKLVAMPAPAIPHTTDALAEAARAARGRRMPEASPVTADQAARMAALEAELAAPAQVVPFPAQQQDTRETRFARALQIEQRVAAEAVVPADDLQWLASYREQPEYRAMRQLYEDFGEQLLA